MPLLYGLVLMGGQSTRMRQDKALLKYHGVEQWQYCRQLLSLFCHQVFLSQRGLVHSGYGAHDEVIVDVYGSLGPLSGILSAMKAHSNAAWLVLAIDMPFVDKETLVQLTGARDASQLATVFVNDGQLPEPLCAIYEPASWPFLERDRVKGPRKILHERADIARVIPHDPKWLVNVNSPSEPNSILSS